MFIDDAEWRCSCGQIRYSRDGVLWSHRTLAAMLCPVRRWFWQQILWLASGRIDDPCQYKEVLASDGLFKLEISRTGHDVCDCPGYEESENFEREQKMRELGVTQQDIYETMPPKPEDNR